MTMNAIEQPRRAAAVERDHPGGCGWPVYEVLCPKCERWARDYGEVTTVIGGVEYALCVPCGDRLFPSAR